jgi:hypothetical protein
MNQVYHAGDVKLDKLMGTARGLEGIMQCRRMGHGH